MASSRSPWEAYRALMLGRLIGLYKCHGVRPVGLLETCQRMLMKSVLVVTGSEAKDSCGI